MTIKPATAADRDEVIALWQAVGLTRPWNNPESDFELALSNPTSTILIASHAGGIVGSVMVGFDGHRGWVYYLATAPSHRKRGVGRVLMQAAEEWLGTLGRPRVRLMVRGDNVAATGFYNAIGYDKQDIITFGRTLD